MRCDKCASNNHRVCTVFNCGRLSKGEVGMYKQNGRNLNGVVGSLMELHYCKIYPGLHWGVN